MPSPDSYAGRVCLGDGEGKAHRSFPPSADSAAPRGENIPGARTERDTSLTEMGWTPTAGPAAESAEAGLRLGRRGIAVACDGSAPAGSPMLNEASIARLLAREQAAQPLVLQGILVRNTQV